MTKLEQVAVCVLVKKREALAVDAKGIKIVLLRDDGSPDYAAGGQIIWIDALKALQAGVVYSVPVFLSPPYVRAESK